MWWLDIENLDERLGVLAGDTSLIDHTAVIEPGAILDDTLGRIVIGPRSKICTGAVLRGPIVIGGECLVGNLSMVRGPVLIGDQVRIGFATEIKQALSGDRVSIGPQCFVADSKVDEDAYLGAQVRTSNQRLDREAISVCFGFRVFVFFCVLLGCWIGARASLGIQVIVLPGRVIAADSLFEPRVTIARNHPSGRYRARQAVELVAA